MSAGTRPESPPATRSADGRAISATLIATAMVGALVAGLGVPTIPTIGELFDTSLVRAQWTVSIPLVVGIVSIPLLARLAELYGRRRILIVTLALIALGGVTSALAHSLPQVLFGRALQGTGYAIIPIAAGLARQHLHGRRLDVAIAMISTSLLVGVGLSSPIVGVLIDVAGLEYAFLGAACVTVLVAVAVMIWVPPNRPTGGHARLDWLGAALVMSGLAVLMLAVEEAARPGSPWAGTAGLAIAGVVLLVAWTWHELRTDDPLIDLQVTVGNGVWIVSVTGTLTGLTMFAGITALNIMLQRPAGEGGLGLTVLGCGIVLLPMSLSGFAATSAVARLSGRVEPAWIMGIGFTAITTGYLLVASFHDEPWHFSAITVLLGSGVGMAYSVHYRIIAERLTPSRIVSATGANHLLRLIGGAVGSTLAAVVLTIGGARGSADGSDFTLVAAVGCVSSTLAMAMVVGWARSERARRAPSRPRSGGTRPRLGQWIGQDPDRGRVGRRGPES